VTTRPTTPQQYTIQVPGQDVSVHATDWGGTAEPAVVLLPGFGMTQRSLAAVATRLAPRRVVTADLRGHGRSTSGPWSFAAAVDDLTAVVQCLGLQSPAVGGHSLGGMIALRYAMAGRPTAGVVNLDGWGPGVASRFVGQDPAVVDAHLAQVATGELAPRLARLLVSRSRQGREGMTRQLMADLHHADVVAWHAAAPCRSLAVNAVAPEGLAVRLLMGRQTSRLQRAHREGLRRDLALLARARPEVTVVEVAATHRLITTEPDVVATAIAQWLRV
jgi:pimeloyl-ACP methyl ester carboxylesterase